MMHYWGRSTAVLVEVMAQSRNQARRTSSVASVWLGRHSHVESDPRLKLVGKKLFITAIISERPQRAHSEEQKIVKLVAREPRTLVGIRRALIRHHLLEEKIAA